MFNQTFSLAFLDGLGGPEMLLVFIMSLMLFGGKKLPELARSVGKTVREFKRAASGVEAEIRKAMDAETPPPPPSRPKPPSALPSNSAGAAAATTYTASPENDEYHDDYHHDDSHHEEYNYDHDEDHKDLESTAKAGEPKVDEAFEAGESNPVEDPPRKDTPIKNASAQDAPDEDSSESPPKKA